MKIINKRAAVLACVGVLFSGCAAQAPRNGVPGSPMATESMDRSSTSTPGFKPDRMLVWKGQLTLTVGNPGESMSKIVEITERFNGYVEQKSASDESSASARLRIPVTSFKNAIGAVELLGDVEYKNVTGEDVTEQYIDVEARLKNKIELRARLRQLLEKASDVKDILTIETELSRLQSEIDAMEGKIRLLRGQVEYATIDVTLHKKKILGPLGLIFEGIWWGIGKLFVISD